MLTASGSGRRASARCPCDPMMHCSHSACPGAAGDLETLPSPDTEPQYPPSNRTVSELPATGQTDQTLELLSPSAGGTGSTQNQEFESAGEPGGNPGGEPEGEPAEDSGGEPEGEHELEHVRVDQRSNR